MKKLTAVLLALLTLFSITAMSASAYTTEAVQVECTDCGSHTVYVEYENDAQKAEAEKTVAMLWNIGKVIKINPGE